jgi:hypothetical protein
MTDLDKMIAIVIKHYGQWGQNPTRMNHGGMIMNLHLQVCLKLWRKKC